MENSYNEDFYIPGDKITRAHKILQFYFQKIGPLFPKSTARLFWHIFTTTRKRKISLKQLNFIQKGSESTFRNVEFNSIYKTLTFGEGSKKALLCHGWEGMTADFQKLIESIADNGIQIVSIEFPGHGISKKSKTHLPMFLSIIKEQINAKSFDVLIGHSLGSAALAMAIPTLEFNQKQKIVLMGLHPEPSQFIYQFKKIAKINDPLFEKCIAFAEKKTQTKLKEYNCHQYISHYNHHELLFVHDSKDRIIHIKRILSLADKIPTALFFEGNHGGHFKHYQHPEAIAAISAFLIR